MKITQKGQVTIPLAMRRKHGLLPPAEIALLDHPDGILVMKARKNSPGKRASETLLKGGQIKGSTKELLKLTRDSER